VEIAYALRETWSLPSFGITFNTGEADDTGCVYWVTEDSGWRGGAAPRPARDSKASGHGQYRRPNYRSGLVVTWNGHIFAPSDTARSQAERKLATIGNDAQNLFEVQGSDSVGSLFSLMELDSATMIEPLTLTDAGFSMQFASPDPRRYAVGGIIGGDTGLAVSAGGLDWSPGLDWDPGLSWGSVSSTGLIIFNNIGLAPTDPVFTITVPSGSLVNPMITLQGTGQRIRYAGTLVAGDSLRIDTSSFSRSAILNGSQDVRTRLDISEWFQLPLGVSVVVFGADNVNAAANLNGTAYIAYW
jgi:hypothetical protein